MRTTLSHHTRILTASLAALLLIGPAAGPAGGAPGGEAVRIVMPTASVTFDPRRWEASLIVANAWKSLGIDVEVVPFPDFPSLAARTGRQPFNYDAFVSTFVGRPERLDPDALMHAPLHSAGIGDGGSNAFGYASPAYDRLADAQRRELDARKRRAIVFQMQELLAKDAPFITLYHNQNVVPYNKERFTAMVPMIGRGLWNFWTLVRARPAGRERTFRLGWADDIDTTNPLANSTAVESMRLVYDFLARIDPDGQAVPWAAESWKKVTSTSVDVTLRQGLTFHDGRPVTVDDVVFSFEFAKRFGTAPYYRSALEPVKSVRRVNDRTVRILLERPFPPLFMITFPQVPILPRHIWENVAQREGVESPARWGNPAPVGSGPFRFVHWRRGEELMLRRFERHFNAPQAEGFLAIHYANTEAVFQALVKGDVDIPDEGITPLQVGQARRVPHLGLATIDDFSVYYLGFNLRRPPFRDAAFRSAVKHTIDYKTIVEAALGGLGVPGTGMMAPVNKFWHNPAWAQWLNTDYKFDLAEARRMLQGAGYSWDAQGRLHYP